MKHQPMLWIFKRIKKRIPALILMTLSNMGTAGLGVYFAIGTKNVINAAVEGTREQLLQAVFIQFSIVAGILLTMTLTRYLHARLAADLEMDWKKQFFSQIIRADYSRISEFHTGELLNRLNNDVRIINDGVLSVVPGVVSMLTKLVAVSAVLFVMEPLFAVVFFSFGALVALTTGFARRFLRNLNKRVSETNGKVSGFLQEVFEKLLLIQGMSLEEVVGDRTEQLMIERYETQKKRWRVTLFANTSVSLVAYASGFAALVWCAFRLFRQEMSFGELVAVSQLVSQLQSPFVSLSGILPQYIAVTAAGERLMELEAACRKELPAAPSAPLSYDDIQCLCGRNLSFSYGRDQVLQSSCFNLPKNSFSVVTGTSGAGKSTLFKLMLGIFKPQDGEIFFQTDHGECPMNEWTRGLFAYVPQGNLLFSGTIRDNLLLTNPEADEAAIQEALHISCFDRVLDQLPDGLDTVLQENGHGLSEGQAQRLSIARALIGGAPILLLDEATSALDQETELDVLNRIHACKGKTCIAVTHRPAAANLASYNLTINDAGILCEARPNGSAVHE